MKQAVCQDLRSQILAWHEAQKVVPFQNLVKQNAVEESSESEAEDSSSGDRWTAKRGTERTRCRSVVAFVLRHRVLRKPCAFLDALVALAAAFVKMDPGALQRRGQVGEFRLEGPSALRTSLVVVRSCGKVDAFRFVVRAW